MHILQRYAQVAHFCTTVLAAAQIVTGKRKGDVEQYGQRLANSVGTATTAVLSEKPQDHVASLTGWPGCICHYHTPMKSRASVWVESSVFKIRMHCNVYLVLIQPRLLQIIQIFILKGQNAVFCLHLKLL